MRSNSGVKIDGYEFFGRVREGGIGGSVGILVRSDIKPNTSSHTSTRNIELTWVSICRKGLPLIFFGAYYGKQEQMSKDRIEQEMQPLSEEIEEMKKEVKFSLQWMETLKLAFLANL